MGGAAPSERREEAANVPSQARTLPAPDCGVWSRVIRHVTKWLVLVILAAENGGAAPACPPALGAAVLAAAHAFAVGHAPGGGGIWRKLTHSRKMEESESRLTRWRRACVTLNTGTRVRGRVRV